MRGQTIILLLALPALGGCLTGPSETGDELSVGIRVTNTADSTYVFEAVDLTGAQPGDVTLDWNLGDGTQTGGPWSDASKVEHTYASTDMTAMVSLVVRSLADRAGFAIEPLALGSGTATPPAIRILDAARWVQRGEEVRLDASTSASAGSVQYEWILGGYVPNEMERSMLGSQTAMSEMHGPTPTEPSENLGDIMAVSATSTGLLARGQSHELTFSQEGVYYLVCHPHPWMQMRVIASNDTESVEPVAVAIRNFAFNPLSVDVRPGGVVNFTNQDPAAHTASQQFMGNGRIVSSTPILAETLGEGMYQARLVVTDIRGSVSTQTWGLRTSTDAPPRVVEQDHSRTGVNNVPPAAPQEPMAMEYQANWTQNLTAKATWTSEPNQGTWNLTLEQEGTTLASCAASGNECSFMTTIKPGKYMFIATVEGTAIQASVNITLSAIQYTNPGFGDSMASGGHQH